MIPLCFIKIKINLKLINQGVKKSKGEETKMKKAFDFNNKNKE